MAGQQEPQTPEEQGRKMNTDPVNAALAILTIPLVVFAGYVAYRVLAKCGPELWRIWRETKQ